MSDEKDLLDQKLAEQEQLGKEIEKLRAQQRKEAISSIKADIKRFDIKPEEIFSSAKPGRKRKAKTAGKGRRKAASTVSPKYRDPETGKTWSGRGREPVWMRGKNRDDYLIQN